MRHSESLHGNGTFDGSRGTSYWPSIVRLLLSWAVEPFIYWPKITAISDVHAYLEFYQVL